MKKMFCGGFIAAALITGAMAQEEVKEIPAADDVATLQVHTTDEFMIPNSPILKPSNIITIRAIGMGVAPEYATNKAQGMALAKRAAIIDAYRQLGEKMHGIHITAKETVKDAVIKSSTIRTKLFSVVRGAEIQETVWQDGLCQVEMEVRLDGRRWYRVLSSVF